MTVTFVKRLSAERGNADHGWLKSYHTFSFASYQSLKHSGYGPLRVINEDRVLPNQGFGTHSHREFEIFSYVVSGRLTHRDSLRNVEILKRGDVQMTSTGTGISHSEYNEENDDSVHFIQIWSSPNISRLTPGYFTRHFTDESKTNALLKVVGPLKSASVVDTREGAGPAPIHSELAMFASILEPRRTLEHTFTSGTKKAYLHHIMTSGYRKPSESPKSSGARLHVSSSEIQFDVEEGDGVYIEVNGSADLELNSCGGVNAEFLLFEIYVV